MSARRALVDQVRALLDAFNRAGVDHILVGSMAMAAHGVVPRHRGHRRMDVPVATPRMLYDMKRGTVQPQDQADALRLLEAFDLTED